MRSHPDCLQLRGMGMMYRKELMYMLMPIFLLFIFNINNAFAGGIPQPYRIAGMVTIDGTKLTSSTASGFKITATNLSGVVLTDANSSSTETTTLGSNDAYILDIPIYDSSSQTGGAKTGDTVVLHLYMNGTEYSIIAPVGGKITVGDSGTNKEVDITAVTTATSVPTISAAPASIDFGSVVEDQVSANKMVTLTNTGNADLTINGITLVGTNTGQFQLGNITGCSTITAGSSCSFPVNFDPTSVGTMSASVSIASNDSANPTVAVTLSGKSTAVPVPTISAAPASIDFGSVVEDQVSANKMVTLTNTGNADLTINGITLVGTNTGQFQLGNITGCSTITAGSSCSFPVNFDPTSVGTMSASVSIASNDSANPTVAVTLSGKSTATKPPVINSFTSDTSSGEVSLDVSFTADATDPAGTITAYKWDFDDGTVVQSTAADTVSHTYNAAGIYNAKVTVVNNNSVQVSSKKSILIIVNSPGGASAQINPGGGKPPVGIMADSGNMIKDATVESVDSGTVGMPTDGKGKPIKEISFTIEGNTSTVVKVTIGPLQIANDTIFYKKVNGKWFDLSENAAKYGLTVNDAKGTVSFNVKDNGELDADTNVGSIHDPLIVAQKTTSNTQTSSSGGGGGCTIGGSNSADISFPLFLLLSVLYLFKKSRQFKQLKKRVWRIRCCK